MSDSTENVPKIDPRTYVRHVRGKDRHVEPRRWPGLIRHLTSDSIDLVLNQHFNKDAILLIDLLTADTAEKHELEVRVVASEPEPNGSWLLHCTYSEPAENKQTKPFEAPAQWTAPRNRLEIAGITSAGVEREQNEDSFAIQHLCWSNLSLYQEVASIVVADGLGGHQAGELASRLAIQTINSQLLPLLGTALAEENSFPSPESIRQRIDQAIRAANDVVFRRAQAMTLHDSIGATAVVAFLYGGDAIIGHVGDCRAYTLRQGNLRQLTRDQTVIEELIQAGKLTEQQAKDHPAVGEVSQAIGCEPTIEPAFYHVTIAPGDWLILASDGLQADLDLKDIETAVKRTNLSPGGLANHLVELANKSGGSDNCTVVVVRAYAPNSDRASQR